MKILNIYFSALCFISLAVIACNKSITNQDNNSGSVSTAGYTAENMPPPNATKSVQNFSEVIGWKEGQMPTAPQGFEVNKFAGDLEHPRWIYTADNGDIFVAESNTILKGVKKLGAKILPKIKTQSNGESANRITLFRDENKDGFPEKKYTFMTDLNQPFGMLIIGNSFYVGNTDGLMKYDYKMGDTSIRTQGKMIVSLPAGGYNNHWTRNIITNAKKDKIYISVGSGSNVGENGLDNEVRRANILEVNLDGSGERIYAYGLRNPVGMDWAPGTQTLWTAVNERDELGDELVPDYITSVKQGGYYGWPFFYYGKNVDPRMKDNMTPPEPIEKVITPEVALGSHTASLGLAFYKKDNFPSKYQNGAFITQHGSWNRSVISGYKVVFVPFKNGKPSGKPEDFLTGFVNDLEKSKVHGRPVGIAVLADGSMLVSDDSSNTIWRVKHK
jgi:glucose/arabinose dehydrogenase